MHFTADAMQQCSIQALGVKANFNISHHLQASGQVERANQTVVNILKKYVASNHRHWDVKMSLVLMAITATPHEATGVSLFEMKTGRQMTLPVHLLYQPGEASVATAYTTHQYMRDLSRHLQANFAFAQKCLGKTAEGRKAYYDRKASHDELLVGKKVWHYAFTKPGGQTALKVTTPYNSPPIILSRQQHMNCLILQNGSTPPVSLLIQTLSHTLSLTQ